VLLLNEDFARFIYTLSCRSRILKCSRNFFPLGLWFRKGSRWWNYFLVFRDLSKHSFEYCYQLNIYRDSSLNWENTDIWHNDIWYLIIDIWFPFIFLSRCFGKKECGVHTPRTYNIVNYYCENCKTIKDFLV